MAYATMNKTVIFLMKVQDPLQAATITTIKDNIPQARREEKGKGVAKGVSAQTMKTHLRHQSYATTQLSKDREHRLHTIMRPTFCGKAQV